MAEASASSSVMTSTGHDDNRLRIVILGKAGVGKSSLGNTLLGKKPPKAPSKPSMGQTDGFVLSRGLKSNTRYCEWDTAVRFGTTIEVTDTPGLFTTHFPEEPTKRKLENIVAMTEPGPHIILYLVRADRRFVPENWMAYKEYTQVFSDGMGRFLIIVFTGLDNFDTESLEENRKLLDKDLKDCSVELSDMIRDAEGRYFGIDNTASEAEKELQAKELIGLMQDLVKRNRGRHYSTEQTQKICNRLEEVTMRWALAHQRTYAAAKPLVKQAVVEGRIAL